MTSGNTSGIRKHLKQHAKENEEYLKLFEAQEQVREGKRKKTSNTEKNDHKQPKLAFGAVTSKEKQKKFDDALIEHGAEAKVSICCVWHRFV